MSSLAQQIRQVAKPSRPLGQQSWPVPSPRAWQVPPTVRTRVSDPTEADHLLARVEGVLFLAREALTLRRIAQLANLTDATKARTILGELAHRYARRGRSYRIENVAGGYRLLTQRQFAPWIVKIGDFCDQPGAELKLTPPALDTLTVVAYRQPVLRAEVEAIRGVACGELLRQLIERGLLRIVGRSEELGRPLEYGTTKRFLQLFGLKSLKDLPPVEGLDGTAPQLAPQTNPPQNVVHRAA